jgi:hypothetical protein
MTKRGELSSLFIIKKIKMKNKKGLIKISVETIFFIFLIFGFLVFIFVGRSVLKPNYSITKEVCHNETNYVQSCIIMEKEFDYNKSINLSVINSMTAIPCGLKEVCENQEVDEIPYYNYSKFNSGIVCLGNFGILKDNLNYFKSPEENCEDHDSSFNYQWNGADVNIYEPLTKKDLTEDWLNQNGECIKEDYGKIIDNFPKFNRSDTINDGNDYSLWAEHCWDNNGKAIFTCEENQEDLLCCYKKLNHNFRCSKWKLSFGNETYYVTEGKR